MEALFQLAQAYARLAEEAGALIRVPVPAFPSGGQGRPAGWRAGFLAGTSKSIDESARGRSTTVS